MKTQYRLFILYAFLAFTNINVYSQKNWELKVDKEGIKVYTKSGEHSSFKSVKTVCTIDASLSRLTAVLLDIDRTVDWVYATKKCSVLKQVSQSESIYYSEIDAPWPVSNRDFIVRLWAVQDEKTKAVSVLAENKPSYLPEHDDIVRIKQSYSKWVIEPLKGGKVKVEYTLQVDPGGNIPAWLINLFATKGPYESFKKLRLQVKKDIYNNVSLPFIKD